jgi:hypothetical protein
MIIQMLAYMLAVLLLALATTALASPVRCTTYEEKTLGRWQTLCDDSTWAVSTWSPTPQQWQTTITEGPRRECTERLNHVTRQMELRCR